MIVGFYSHWKLPSKSSSETFTVFPSGLIGSYGESSENSVGIAFQWRLGSQLASLMTFRISLTTILLPSGAKWTPSLHTSIRDQHKIGVSTQNGFGWGLINKAWNRKWSLVLFLSFFSAGILKDKLTSSKQFPNYQFAALQSKDQLPSGSSHGTPLNMLLNISGRTHLF